MHAHPRPRPHRRPRVRDVQAHCIRILMGLSRSWSWSWSWSLLSRWVLRGRKTSHRHWEPAHRHASSTAHALRSPR